MTVDHEALIEQLAEYITDDADSPVIVRTWTVDDRSRVYISRTLSRGRRQTMGYIEITESGEVLCYAERRVSVLDGWRAVAEQWIANN